MKRTLLRSLALMATGFVLSAQAVAATPADKTPSTRFSMQAVQQHDLASFAPKVHTNGRQTKTLLTRSADGLTSQVQTNGGWGYLYDENDLPCFYTIENTTSGNYYYSAATIDIWDNSHEHIATIKVDVPDTLSVNQIAPYGDLTTSFFDGKSSTRKVAVELHAVGNASNNYRGRYLTYIYSLDGTLVAQYEGMGQFATLGSGWQRTTRFVLANSVYTTDAETNEETETLVYDIYKGGYGGATVEHTFSFDANLCYYSDASPLQMYDIDGKFHYVVCKYDKPYANGSDDLGFPTLTPDNKYTVVCYDNRFNQVDSIAVDFTAPDDVNFRMAEFGSLGYKDLSKDYFSSTGQFDYVVTFADYSTSSSDDGYVYSFAVYNNEGEKTHNICDNVVNTWSLLADVKGESDQMVFMQIVDGNQQQQMIDLPSCEKKTLLPAELDGITVTTTLNRYPVADGYDYLVKLSAADSDADGNVLAPIAWVRPDLTVERYTRFNLGPDAEYFLPYLYEGAMNPYLFNTDDKLEFLYIAKVKKADGSGLEKILVVANEDGDTLRTFRPNSDVGEISMGALLTDNKLQPELEIVSLNDDEVYTRQFYSLPFTQFEAGGDGTKQNPYLISTVGDLRMVARQPEANYQVVADLNFDTDPLSWTPIDGFAGELDGQGHVLSHLYVDTDDSEAGLFATMAEKAKVGNLIIASPTIVATASNRTIGVLAASCVTDSINNVHVFDANIAGTDASAVVGGLVGEASLYSSLAACSFSGTIDTPSASSVGGIVGKLGTSTDVRACAASGDFTAESQLGGIVGDMGYMPSSVNDCHASVDLTAQYSIGGIAGSSDGRSTIDHSYASGSITANYTGGWNAMAVGGIIGYLASDWTASTDTIISHCVATNQFSLPTDAEVTSADGFATAHRIAGRTIADEEWYDGETPSTEQGLAENYSTTTSVGANAISSTDDKSVEGKDLAVTQLSDDFATGLGYAHGSTPAEPWQAVDYALPVLYFERQPLALGVDRSVVTLAIDAETDVTATLYGRDASENIAYTVDGETVASVSENSASASTVSLHIVAKALGEQIITFTAGQLSTTCTVKVVDYDATAIADAPSVSSFAIVREGENVKAEGATAISIYSIEGKLVKKTAANHISVAHLQSGIYVVEALGEKGEKAVVKVVVK